MDQPEIIAYIYDDNNDNNNNDNNNNNYNKNDNNNNDNNNNDNNDIDNKKLYNISEMHNIWNIYKFNNEHKHKSYILKIKEQIAKDFSYDQKNQFTDIHKYCKYFFNHYFLSTKLKVLDVLSIMDCMFKNLTFLKKHDKLVTATKNKINDMCHHKNIEYIENNMPKYFDKQFVVDLFSQWKNALDTEFPNL